MCNWLPFLGSEQWLTGSHRHLTAVVGLLTQSQATEVKWISTTLAVGMSMSWNRPLLVWIWNSLSRLIRLGNGWMDGRSCVFSNLNQSLSRFLYSLLTYSHPLLLSSTEDIHPVLDWVPAALSVQNVTQLNIVQVFLQHLETRYDKTSYIMRDMHRQSKWKWSVCVRVSFPTWSEMPFLLCSSKVSG